MESERRLTRSSSIGFRVHATVKAAIERAATSDNRSVASYIEKLVLDDLRAKGILDQDGQIVPKSRS